MILVCGEALVDLFLSPAKGGDVPARAVAGGSPFNVAIGIRRLGGRSAFFGGLSKDQFGTVLADMLAKEGVALDFARVTDRLSTISVVAMDASGVPSYAFHGEGKADRMLTEADLPESLPSNINALTFGSYTLAVEPVGSTYLTLARREAPARVISIDPNVRPTVTPDIAAWRTRFETFLPLADIVKASDEDIATGYGHGADIEAVARDWLTQGAKLVVVTRGGEGAVAFSNTVTLRLPGRRVAVVDTVGAGDTFHATLLSRLDALGKLTKSALANLDETTIADIMHHAIVAASITCSRRGADLPTTADVATALKENC
ncbi:MAG: carbohydrate kinase [Proteobacteria bacterium]|nr:carbohydrate kinase [Pseudomonadota bacterium]